MSKPERIMKQFEITKEQRARFDRLVPWGTGNRLISWMLDGLLDVMEEHKDQMVMFCYMTPEQRPRIVFLYPEEHGEKEEKEENDNS